ncbi:carbohydrate ABC transporter permease [Nocardia sp. BMG111209]|uniref:carbohydrate ABC transporter permease n=1 Tax=Nocardia sp. BMG111209 TaxID=1160137 RepID=UPI0004778A5C|nr:sugar ABC transporter permease [Nocardia sp. BMG111209]
MSRTPSRAAAALRALPWIGPVLVLIAAIVGFPAGYMLWTSTRDLSAYGTDRGPAGWANFRKLFALEELPRILLHTLAWTVAVVVITLALSAALAQFLNKDFPGRTAVRLAILVPWAASVVMTTTVFDYLLDPDVGLANRFLVDIGVLHRGFGFTKEAGPAFLVAIGVAAFVSIPFTTYTILAGLQAIPAEMDEAGRVDGASPWQRYRYLTLPQLRSAMAVATVINLINAFNSLPILQVLTGSIAGFDADTTTTLTFKLIRQNQQLATAAAMSVLNFVLIAVIIAIYVKVIRPAGEEAR